MSVDPATPAVDYDLLAKQGDVLLLSGDQNGLLRTEIGLQIASAAMAGLDRADPARAEVVLLLARSLRRRADWERQPEDLVQATEMLDWELLWERRPAVASRMRSERALATAGLVQHYDSLPSPDPQPPAALRQATLDLMTADLALAAASAGADAAAGASLAHARGMLGRLRGLASDAVADLRKAYAAAPERVDIARDFCIALMQSGDTALRLEGAQLLGELADRWASSRPRDGFAAYRELGWMATALDDWPAAANAFDQAARCRRAARALESDDYQQQRWLRTTFTIYADAAMAHLRAGQATAAAAALEGGVGLELKERQGIRAVDSETDADEAVVYVSITDAGSAALLASSGGIEAVQLGLSYDQLSAAVVEYLAKYDPHRANPESKRNRREWMISIEQVFDTLAVTVVKPILDALPDSVRLVSLVPIGDVGLLPLHAVFALHEAELAVRYVPSARGVARDRRTEHPDSALVVVEPVTPGMQPLPFAHAEAAAVRSAFAVGEDLVGEAATLEDVVARISQHDLLHFACHGEHRALPVEASRLLLAGGESLTMARLMGESDIHARLVVLSACETAIQELWLTDERLGMVLAFLQAGTAGVVGTMWAVGDRSSALLMSRFYAEWRKIAEPTRALCRAQAWLRTASTTTLRSWLVENPGLEPMTFNDPADAVPFDHPWYWAGFALYGT